MVYLDGIVVIRISFLLMTTSIMAVSIIIIYRAFKFLGMDIRPEALVLCGVLAFFVNFTAISVSEYLTASHFILLGGLIVLSAALVTFYNRWLIKRAHGADGVLAVENLSESELFVPNGAIEESSHEEVLIPAPALESVDEAEEVSPAVTTEPPKVDPVMEVAIEKENIENDAMVNKPSAVLAHISEEPSLDPTEKEVPIEPNDTSEDSEAPIPNPEERYLHMVKEVSALKTMDDILDYAYRQKTNDNWANALYAYKCALERFRNDSYAPFVAIEICNIYKANGFYSGAIETYEEALDFPALEDDPEMRQTFLQSINYLKITEYLLEKAQTPGLPFSKIPNALRQTIEQAYKLSNTRKIV